MSPWPKPVSSWVSWVSSGLACPIAEALRSVGALAAQAVDEIVEAAGDLIGRLVGDLVRGFLLRAHFVGVAACGARLLVADAPRLGAATLDARARVAGGGLGRLGRATRVGLAECGGPILPLRERGLRRGGRGGVPAVERRVLIGERRVDATARGLEGAGDVGARGGEAARDLRALRGAGLDHRLLLLVHGGGGRLVPRGDARGQRGAARIGGGADLLERGAMMIVQPIGDADASARGRRGRRRGGGRRRTRRMIVAGWRGHRRMMRTVSRVPGAGIAAATTGSGPPRTRRPTGVWRAVTRAAWVARAVPVWRRAVPVRRRAVPVRCGRRTGRMARRARIGAAGRRLPAVTTPATAATPATPAAITIEMERALRPLVDSERHHVAHRDGLGSLLGLALGRAVLVGDLMARGERGLAGALLLQHVRNLVRDQRQGWRVVGEHDGVAARRAARANRGELAPPGERVDRRQRPAEERLEAVAIRHVGRRAGRRVLEDLDRALAIGVAVVRELVIGAIVASRDARQCLGRAGRRWAVRYNRDAAQIEPEQRAQSRADPGLQRNR